MPGTSPSLPIERYTGIYSDSLYGDLKIGLENGHLIAQFGPAFIGDLEHWHYDTFRITWRNTYFDKNRVSFVLDEDGKVKEARTDLEGTVVFGRRPEPDTAGDGSQ